MSGSIVATDFQTFLDAAPGSESIITANVSLDFSANTNHQIAPFNCNIMQDELGSNGKGCTVIYTQKPFIMKGPAANMPTAFFFENGAVTNKTVYVPGLTEYNPSNTFPTRIYWSTATSFSTPANMEAAESRMMRQVSITGVAGSQTGTTTNTSATVTGLSSTPTLGLNQSVTGTGIPANTFISTIDSGTQITLTNAATGSASPTLTFGASIVNARDTDDILEINNFSSLPVTVNIASPGLTSRALTVKDGLGNAATNHFIITPAAIGNGIINTGFSSDTIWVKGTGWTITGNKAVATAATANLTQTLLLKQLQFVGGRSYTVTFTVASRTGGSLSISLGGGTAGASVSSNATFTQTIVAGYTSQDIVVAAVGLTATLDSITAVPTGYYIENAATISIAENNGFRALVDDGQQWRILGGVSSGAQLGVAQTFSGAQSVSSSVLTSTSNATAIDLSLNNDFTYTLTQNSTLSLPSNIVAGTSGRIAITQGAGPYTLGYASVFKFSNGFSNASPPAVSTANGALDTLFYDVVDSTHILCTLVKGWS